MTTTLDTLRRARELLSEPERWTQETEARDARGRRVPFHDPTADRWCALGALALAEHHIGIPDDELCLAHNNLRQAAGCHNIAVWNDAFSRTHAEVLAAFDRAIDRLEKEQAP